MHINLLFQYCTTLKAITETTFRLQGIEECSFVFKCRKLIDPSASGVCPQLIFLRYRRRLLQRRRTSTGTQCVRLIGCQLIVFLESRLQSAMLHLSLPRFYRFHMHTSFTFYRQEHARNSIMNMVFQMERHETNGSRFDNQAVLILSIEK